MRVLHSSRKAGNMLSFAVQTVSRCNKN